MKNNKVFITSIQRKTATGIHKYENAGKIPVLGTGVHVTTKLGVIKILVFSF